MRDGFIKVAVSTPDLRVADSSYNVERMIETAEKLAGQGVKLLAFPELSLNG